jgi:hypothetical protein
LTGDQVAVGHRVNAPVLDLGKDGAEVYQFVLDEDEALGVISLVPFDNFT